ncbi:hypothetical protein KC318_g189 [Hortaea werneckii]|nr:hypothetical protein KC334_g5905 [Hortaea werneckii]KAI6946371.1 hypothetical protein KC355_g15080 [Hortaea werneckii]KAI7676544.1 hypothetical protein KC318_g189 [Hortaea werneckii]
MEALKPRGGHFGLILPLCTSSATVGLSLFQYPLFGSFLGAEPSIAGKPLSRFWNTFLAPGASMITTVALTSATAGAFAARWLRTHATLETNSVASWYTWGSILAAGHLAFVPLVAGPIKRMAESERKGSVMTEEEADRTNREEQKVSQRSEVSIKPEPKLTNTNDLVPVAHCPNFGSRRPGARVFRPGRCVELLGDLDGVLAITGIRSPPNA